MAAWWAFEQKDTGNGFEGGYNAWLKLATLYQITENVKGKETNNDTSAADATSHLFFAYLRSLAPEQNMTGITMLPRSLEKLIRETEYPPQKPELMMTRTNKVAMIVENVSPTPFALLRRTNHFQYRDSDKALQEFSGYEDPVQALSEECKRVLRAVSAANQSQVSSAKHSTSLREASWSRFEDVGFSSALQEEDEDDDSALAKKQPEGLKTSPSSGNGFDRPTTPSWADFLSSGFVDDNQSRSNLLLPPDKVLPPIETQNRQRSSQSHRPRLESARDLDPGELASITFVDLDECFWWVWMSSLAPEETPERKAAFGRCAVIETKIRTGRWLVMEEMVAGAAPEPQEGAYIAEKKGFFSWARTKTLSRRKSTGKHALDRGEKPNNFSTSKTSIGPDTHAKIQAKAAQLRAAGDQEKQDALNSQRRGRDADAADKTNSVMSLQPNIAGEASSAMKWVNKYDKVTIKDAYMANSNAGRGTALSPVPTDDTNGHAETNGSTKQPEKNPEVPKEEPQPRIEARAPAGATSLPARKPVGASKATKPEPEKKESVQAAPAAEKAEEASVDPLEQPEAAPEATPALPPKDETPSEATEAAPVTPELTPVKKQTKEKSGGFRKLFSRKNRGPKRSETVDQNAMARKGSHSTEISVQPTLTEDTASTIGDTYAKTEDNDRTPTPKASEAHLAMDTATPAQHGNDATQAKHEFSRFNQGPLADQPAFAPADDGDSTPSIISRRTPQRSGSSLKSSHEAPKEEHLSHSASPGVQDRWAQIRKNAAERAAQYQRPDDEPTRSFKEKSANDDEDTSGEESK